MSAIGLVARRELRERLRARSFSVLTGLLVVAILAVGVIARIAGDDAPEALDVGVVGGSSALLEAVRQAATDVGIELDATAVDDARTARAALDDGDLDVALVPGDEELLVDGEVDERAAAVLQLAWAATSTQEALAAAGVDPATVAEVLHPAPLRVREVGTDDADAVSGLAALTGTVTAVLLFMSLQTFGSYVLMGVVEEKASAVVEVLLVRITPVQLLAGKVIGIGTAALVQFAVAVAAGVASLVVSGADVPSDIYAALPTAVLWFLGGYALYSTLFALAGSLVSRQEDAQAAAAPISTVLILAYLVIFLFGYAPRSTAARILSIIPPFAPFSMPMRMTSGAASVVEIGVALVLLAATVAGTATLASRIYAQVLLRRGTRIAWKDALRTLRSSA